MAAEPNDIDRYVANKVSQARRDRGITQRQLATAIGITSPQLQKYERGVNRIGAGRLYRIAEALHVPVSYFFEGIAETGEAPPNEAPSALGDMIQNPETRRAFLSLGRAIAQSPGLKKEGHRKAPPG